MHDLTYQLHTTFDGNNSGSYSTRSTLRRNFSVIAANLEEIGFRHMTIRSLKPKHVEALVAHWKSKELALGTIKNLITALRKWSEYIVKENVVKRSNRAYGIEDRVYVTSVSKATR